MVSVIPTVDSRAVVRAAISDASEFDATFVTMNVLATVIACYGLLENSPSVVIGAMIVAMLLGPISGVALGLVDGNNFLVGKALATLAGGIAVIYGTALLIGAAHSSFPLTNEIVSRTAPNLMDLIVALAGGAAGAYALTSSRLNVAAVGVAISTALVPPLSTSALCLARGEYRSSGGALLLAVANMVGIQIAGSVTLWLRGYRGERSLLAATGAVRRNLVSLLALGSLAILLGVSLQRMIRDETYQSAVRNVLRSQADRHPGAFLADVRFRREGARTIVTAVYRTPVAFTPQDVDTMQLVLPRKPKFDLELRVRSIPITVASKDGYRYPADDPIESASWR
jgi:uncharacterized hydrophobic protein (TIGR00271 family)